MCAWPAPFRVRAASHCLPLLGPVRRRPAQPGISSICAPRSSPVPKPGCCFGFCAVSVSSTLATSLWVEAGMCDFRCRWLCFQSLGSPRHRVLPTQCGGAQTPWCSEVGWRLVASRCHSSCFTLGHLALPLRLWPSLGCLKIPALPASPPPHCPASLPVPHLQRPWPFLGPKQAVTSVPGPISGSQALTVCLCPSICLSVSLLLSVTGRWKAEAPPTPVFIPSSCP